MPRLKLELNGLKLIKSSMMVGRETSIQNNIRKLLKSSGYPPWYIGNSRKRPQSGGFESRC